MLRKLPQVLVETLAAESMDHGHLVMGEVGFPVGSARVGRQVEIELGDAIETPSRTWVPLGWKPAAGEAFFPAIEGELVAAALGKDLTQIGLSARYKPPFGALGSTLDRMFLHRVAEATVQDFVQRIANAIENGWRLREASGYGDGPPSIPGKS